MTINEYDIKIIEDSTSFHSEDKISESEKEIELCEGDQLMVRRLLKNQPSELQQSQQENQFHPYCKDFENICSVIMDGGSY